ncbi:uncharacterized protein [Dendrobates tinctorius]|uniref:uncharacterized protein isoform X3 n=1 Tax=Dendrobates tinctorius TaxID=92724 RepID=UPI003CC92974
MTQTPLEAPSISPITRTRKKPPPCHYCQRHPCNGGFPARARPLPGGHAPGNDVTPGRRSPHCLLPAAPRTSSPGCGSLRCQPPIITTPKTQIPSHHPDFSPSDEPDMDEDESNISRRIIDFTSEIISLLSGEDYTIEKKTSGDCVTPIIHLHVSGGGSSNESPITEAPHSPMPEKKILDLTTEITELLTGEPPIIKTPKTQIPSHHPDFSPNDEPDMDEDESNISRRIIDFTSEIISLLSGEVRVRCQDAAVYFSMEEWEYMEGQKDQDQDVRRKNDPTRIDQDKSNMTARVLLLALEIMDLLKGKEHTVVKKTSGDRVTPCMSGGRSKIQSPITEPLHCPTPEKKVLDLANKITELLTGEVPVRCQDAAVYFSMEEWEYMEGQKDQDQDVRRKNDPTRIDQDKSNMTARVLLLALEIIDLLKGKEHTVVKKTSGDRVTPCVSGGRSKIQSPITEPLHCPTPEKKVLDLANKITELLTGEVPVRCQDAAVYFSMEEWEYMEGQKDQDQDVRRKNDPTRIDQDKSNMTARVLLLALEMMDLLKGKEHTVVKKTSGDRVTPCMSGGRSKIPSPITEPLHCPTPEKKVLELANKITELLTGEVPLRCQDVALYFSMEEWDYVGGHWDQYKDVVVEEHRLLVSPENASDRPGENVVLSLECNVKEEDILCQSSGENLITFNVHREHLVKCKRSRTREKPYSCSECKKCFSHKYNLICHQRIHTGEKPYSCSECKKCFSRKYHLTRHQRIHTGEKPYLCSECGKCFINRSNFVLHEKRHKIKMPFSCSECGKCFSFKVLLVRHQRIHTGERPFSCLECGKCFIDKSDLGQHEKIHKVKPYSCSECKKCFSRKYHLTRHQRIHIGEKPYSCSECGKRFINRSNHVLHEKRHKIEMPYSCSECGKCFSKKSNLLKHKIIHKVKKPFSCSECGKCFIGKSDLVRHLRIHTGEKPYSCSECGKCFIGKSDLVRHERIHTGVKPYSCSECEKCFSLKVLLVRHQRIQHTGDRPFSCSECGKCFIDKSNLGQHEKIHKEKPYSCSECKKCFSHKYHLTRHQRIHTGKKPYSCSECGKNFITKSNLVLHEKRHKIEMPNSCSEYGKCFIDKSDLGQHEKIHKEKPYSCSECGKCFLLKSYLVKHERVHTGEKPYSCSGCQKSYKYKSSLIKHERIHTGEKPYSEYEKCFKEKSDIIAHKRIHTGVKPYSCSKCQKVFRCKSSLTAHEIIHTENAYTCSECGKFFICRSHLLTHVKTHREQKLYSCSDCRKCFNTEALLSSHQRDHTGENPVTCSECGISFIFESSLLRHKKIHVQNVENVSLKESFQVKRQRSYTVEKPYSCSECGKSFISKDKLHSHQRSHTGGLI